MSGWFQLTISWANENISAKQGFTRGTDEEHNILKAGPLCITFGIEGRE